MSTPTLDRIVKLAQTQRDLEREIEELEATTKEKNKALERIRGGHQSEGELPQAMQEAELSEFKLDDGTTISIKEELVPPSMAASSATREPMLKWLEDHKLGDAIKNSINVIFAKGDKRVPKVVEQLEKLGIPFENFATIHPSTLKSIIKELVEKGEEVPLDELSIRIFRQSKVK